MNIVFEKMNEKHEEGVMSIFNYYVENSTAAFPANTLPNKFYTMLMKKSEGYPSYTLIDSENDCIIGFCQLSPYNPFSTFAEVACITYFIAPNYTGNGLGYECLLKLEEDAKVMGIKTLLAEVSSENTGSILFHKKHGFAVVGELKDIGTKFNRKFGIVYMQKEI